MNFTRRMALATVAGLALAAVGLGRAGAGRR